MTNGFVLRNRESSWVYAAVRAHHIREKLYPCCGGALHELDEVTCPTQPLVPMPEVRSLTKGPRKFPRTDFTNRFFDDRGTVFQHLKALRLLCEDSQR